MDQKRIEFHEKLVEVLGSRNVYYQPPESIKLKYPCIIYQRAADHRVKADNCLYYSKRRYELTVIDKDADSEIPDKLIHLPYCSFDRSYTADNLYHYSFTMYF